MGITRFVVAVGMAAALATAADAAFISFASDTGGSVPTLRGSGGTTITDNNNPAKLLKIDPLENGITSSADIKVSLIAPLVNPQAFGQDVLWGISRFIFQFRDANTNNLLFSFVADNNDPRRFLSLGAGGGVIAGTIAASGQYTIDASVAGLFGFNGTTQINGQASFTLTGLNPAPAAYLLDGNQNIVGISDFTSGSSFSGNFIPTPGAAGLAAIACLAGIRRRR